VDGRDGDLEHDAEAEHDGGDDRDDDWQALDAMAREHARLVALLDGLQTLARGDAGVLPTRESVDLPALLTEAVHAARSRYPQVTFALDPDDSESIVDGWPAGLRLAVDNLLDNAARHGRAHGHIDVRLRVRDRTVTLTVADDGPGVPEPERDAMRERFTRGPGSRHDGSGLGLALVDQQTTLHQGSLRLGTSSTGGLLVTIQIPVADPAR
jgi:two-component system sensor histidine kinase PrrB